MTFVHFQIFILGTSYTCYVKLLYIALVTQHVCTNIHNLLITWPLDWHHDTLGGVQESLSLYNKQFLVCIL